MNSSIFWIIGVVLILAAIAALVIHARRQDERRHRERLADRERAQRVADQRERDRNARSARSDGPGITDRGTRATARHRGDRRDRPGRVDEGIDDTALAAGGAMYLDSQQSGYGDAGGLLTDPSADRDTPVSGDWGTAAGAGAPDTSSSSSYADPGPSSSSSDSGTSSSGGDSGGSSGGGGGE